MSQPKEIVSLVILSITFNPATFFLQLPCVCCETGSYFINLFIMHMGNSVEIACRALMASEETISELKVECENQKSLWKQDIYI